MADKDVGVRYMVALLAFAVHAVFAISPISVKGTKLYDEDGKQFFVKGVAYRPIPSANEKTDPLLDPFQCQMDADLISKLGANTIRVFAVSDDGDHSDCMQIFAESGIYVWLDLERYGARLSRVNPEWTESIYDTWTRTIDNFARHDNLLFFTVGEDVIWYENELGVAPYIKAAVRDLKAFRRARGYRPIPIIYASTPDIGVRNLTAKYLACEDEAESLDAYSIHVYRWCNETEFYDTGYDKLEEEFQDLHVPVLFSDTSCKRDDGDGDFADVEAMLGQRLQEVFSGLVVWQWSEHGNGYGLVKYPMPSLGKGSPTTLARYNSLSEVFATMKPSGTSRDSYTPSNSPPECPDAMSEWVTEDRLPTIRGLDVATVTPRPSRIDSLTRSDGQSRTGTGPTSGSETSGSSQGGKEEEGKESGDGSGGNSSGLSAGAIGGIATAVSVVNLAAIGAAVFFILRKRKALQVTAASQGGSDGQVHVKSAHSATVHEVASPTPELDAGGQNSWRRELDGQHGVYGPGSATNPIELDTNMPQQFGNRQ